MPSVDWAVWISLVLQRELTHKHTPTNTHTPQHPTHTHTHPHTHTPHTPTKDGYTGEKEEFVEKQGKVERMKTIENKKENKKTKEKKESERGFVKKHRNVKEWKQKKLTWRRRVIGVFGVSSCHFYHRRCNFPKKTMFVGGIRRTTRRCNPAGTQIWKWRTSAYRRTKVGGDSVWEKKKIKKKRGGGKACFWIELPKLGFIENAKMQF